MKSTSLFLQFISWVAAMGGFLFGFDMAVISGVLPFMQQQFDLSATQEGWLVSSALVGCIVGVAGSGTLGDQLGRKKLLIVAALFFFFSAIGSSLLPSFGSIIWARIVGGLGVGIASNIVPLYLSEIAPAHKRGRYVTFYQLAITVGILTAYLSNYGIMVMWVADAIVGQLTAVMLREIGTSYTFLFFAFFCAIAFLTVYRLLPETKGKSLDEIDVFWKKPNTKPV